MVGRRSLRTEQNGFVVVGGTEEVEGGGRENGPVCLMCH